MSLAEALDTALDAPDREEGPVRAEADGRQVEVDVVEADRLGVRVRQVRVRRDEAYDVEGVAERWPRDLRELPERLAPVEVDPGLGGATLRSDPDEMRDERFVEVEVRGDQATVRRWRGGRGAERQAEDWTVTREQLGRLVDTLGDG